jgi:glutamine phosphoribosylpyrophosphate amidotransferase
VKVVCGVGSEHVLKGKIVVVVDDSIVRGTTARQLVGLIYAAGAKEVPMRRPSHALERRV